MVVIKDNIVEPHSIQGAAGEFISQQGGVAFHIGVKPFFLDQIGGNPLNLLRRTTMESGQGDRLAHSWGDGPHIGLVQMLEPI